jgi:hypothetical protein
MYYRLIFHCVCAAAVLHAVPTSGSIVTHFVDGIAPGQFADVSRLLDNVGIGSGNVGSETTSTSFVVPGRLGTDTDLTFSFVRDTGAFKFNFGFFDLNVVSGIDPVTDSTAWARQAVLQGVNVFDDRLVNPGATAEFTVAAGIELGFYLIPNLPVNDFLASSGGVALFSESLVNPGQLDQMLSFITDETALFTFEDLIRTGPSDNDFTDMAFTLTADPSDGGLSGNVVANPEPQTIVVWSVLGLSVAGVRFWRRRRKSK